MKKKNLKVLLAFLVLGFGFSVISAAYFFGYIGNIEAQVFGGDSEQLIIVQDIGNFMMNVSGGEALNSQELSLWNENGQVNLTLSMDVNKTLLDENCTDYINDCEVVLYKGLQALSDNDLIQIEPGYNNFMMNTSCVERSCLQNIEVNIELQ